MKVSKLFSFAAIAMVAAVPVFAQTAPPTPPPTTGQPPATQQPPATPPAGAQAPAAQPAAPQQPPKPFPEGAKIAYINVQAIASNSVEGKAATARIQEFTKKKMGELQAKNKQAQDLQAKLQQGGGVLSDAARSQSEKELQKLQRELQGMQEDAEQEQRDLTDKLQAEFQGKLNPIIDQVANEKNLHVVFDAVNSGMVWANTGLDITAEVMKRFDAAVAKPAAPKK